MSVFVEQNSSWMSFSGGESWTILSSLEQSIKKKIEAVGTPLKDWDVSINYGIKTGLNDAFIISGEKKDELIAADPKSAEIIRPILRGRDIKRYSFTFCDLWVIIAKYGSYEYLETQYPAVYKHLSQYEEQLKKRGQCRYTSSGKTRTDKPYPGQHHWLELDNNPRDDYLDDLSAQKIVWGEISDKPKFSIDLDGKYCPEATTFLMTGSNLKYLLCFLNSTFSEYFFAKYGTTTGMGTLRWKKYLIELLPVPKVSCEIQTELESILDKLLSNSSDQEQIIQRINEFIYNILNLSAEEVEFIETMVAQGAH